MSSENGASSTRAQLLAAIRETDRFLLTTHERPDGDAVGSLAAMQLVLTAIGKDSLAFLYDDSTDRGMRIAELLEEEERR